MKFEFIKLMNLITKINQIFQFMGNNPCFIGIQNLRSQDLFQSQLHSKSHIKKSSLIQD